MTKVTIIGDETPIEKKKPIQLVKCIGAMCILDAQALNYMWKNIELITKNYDGGYDLMFAYNNKRDDGIAYFGYFNDSIVEEEVTND